MVIGRHDSPPTAIAACARFGNTRYQTDAGLQGPVEVFASFKQACRAPSKSSPASRRLAGTRRSLRQLHAGLQGLVEVFASFTQACRDSSKSSPASNRLAETRRSLRQPQAGLQGPDIQYISSKQACMDSIYSIPTIQRQTDITPINTIRNENHLPPLADALRIAHTAGLGRHD